MPGLSAGDTPKDIEAIACDGGSILPQYCWLLDYLSDEGVTTTFQHVEKESKLDITLCCPIENAAAIGNCLSENDIFLQDPTTELERDLKYYNPQRLGRGDNTVSQKIKQNRELGRK